MCSLYCTLKYHHINVTDLLCNFFEQTFTYSLVNPDPKLPFSISGDDLVTTRPLDFETRKSWAVEVKSTDPGGLSATHTYQVGNCVMYQVFRSVTGVNLMRSSLEFFCEFEKFPATVILLLEQTHLCKP